MTTEKDTMPVIRNIALGDIFADYKWNARREEDARPDALGRTIDDASLLASVAEIGVQQPLDVEPHPDMEGRYILRAGFRRFAAACAAQRESVPCIVRAIDGVSPRERNLIENLARKPLLPCEVAKQLGALAREGKAPKELAATFGMSPESVANYIRIRNKAAQNVLEYWDRFPETPVRHLFAVLTVWPKEEQLPKLLELVKGAAAAKKPRAASTKKPPKTAPTVDEMVEPLPSWRLNGGGDQLVRALLKGAERGAALAHLLELEPAELRGLERAFGLFAEVQADWCRKVVQAHREGRERRKNRRGVRQQAPKAKARERRKATRN